jgi:hypothetical protein
MDMTFEEYTNFLNSLMMQVFLHEVEMACDQWDREATQSDDDDDGLLIDEA